MSSEQASVEQATHPYVGRWHRLVSTTNWEKGQIIVQWRRALERDGASPVEFSDEAWSRRVGCITSQHVGRLRRVYDRFGHAHEQYAGLFWSHFHAAVEWDDAEMWLEGAVQNRWTVADMRRQRWETLAGVARGVGPDEDAIATELDEDFEPAAGPPPAEATMPAEMEPPTLEEVRPLDSTKRARDAQSSERAGGRGERGAADGLLEGNGEPDGDAVPFDVSEEGSAARGERPAAVRPLANLVPLPDDLTDAFDELKLAIVRHKQAGWVDTTADHVVAHLRAMEQLALAPSGDEG